MKSLRDCKTFLVTKPFDHLHPDQLFNSHFTEKTKEERQKDNEQMFHLVSYSLV